VDEKIDYRQIPLARLGKEDYMRERDEQRVRRIARSWNPRLLQPLTVVHAVGVEGEPEQWVLIDGDHRKGAAEEREIAKLWCQIIEGPIPRRERARIFHDLQQQRRALSTRDRYRALLAAEDPETVGIQSILDHYGLRVSAKLTPESITAVQALQFSYRMGEPPGDVLSKCLGLITAKWRGRDKAFNGELIPTLSRFITDHQEQPPFITALGKMMEEWPPNALLLEATAIVSQRGGSGRGSRSHAVALADVLKNKVMLYVD
jgi:hypothetical protein